MWGRESNLHTKFLPNQTKIAKVVLFSNFSGGSLVGPFQIKRFLKKIPALKHIIKALAQSIFKISHF